MGPKPHKARSDPPSKTRGVGLGKAPTASILHQYPAVGGMVLASSIEARDFLNRFSADVEHRFLLRGVRFRG